MPRKNPKYKAWVKQQDCANCMAPGPSDPHHAISMGMGGMGMTAPDLMLIPLCRGCHTDLHHSSGEGYSQADLIVRTQHRAIEAGVL